MDKNKHITQQKLAEKFTEATSSEFFKMLIYSYLKKIW